MKSYRHYHANFEHYIHSDLAKFQLFTWMHSLGRALISVFIPVLLFISGFSVKEILFYYFIYYLFDIFLNIAARESIIRFGSKISLGIGLSAEILFFATLIFLEHNYWFLLLLALIAAIYDSFFWVTKWFIFSECIYKKKNVGKELGIVSILQNFASLIAPVIGGLFLLFANKNYLIFLVILIFSLAIIPFSKINLKKLKAKREEGLFDYLKKPKNRKNLILISLIGIHFAIEDDLIPLFIFISFASIQTVSFLPLLVSIGSILFTVYVCKLVDSKNPLKLIIIGSLAGVLFWILRFYFPQEQILLGTTIFLSLFISIAYFPIDSQLVKAANQKNLLDTSMYRNFAFMIPPTLIFLVLFFVAEIFEPLFLIVATALFVLMAFSSLLLKKLEKENLV